MDINNLTNVYNQNPTLQSQYTLQQYLDLFGGSSTPAPPAPPTPPPAPPTPPDQGIIGVDLNQGGDGGINTLNPTWTQPRATNVPKVNMSSDPRTQLTGKGRLDPMGSGYYDTLNKLEATNPSKNYPMSTFNEGFAPPGEIVRGEIDYNPDYNPNIRKAFFESVYQEPAKQSWWDKTKEGISSFLNKYSTPKVRGTLGTRLANAPRLPLPGAMASWSQSPFNEKSRNYNPDIVGELNYLEGQDGMVGRDQKSGLLKYGPESVLSGKNVISMFGSNSYAKALDKYIDRVTNKYNEIVDKYGVDSEKAQKYKFNFVDKSLKEREKNTKNAIDIAKAQEEAASLTAAASKAESARQYDPNVHGATNYGLGSDGQQSYSNEALGGQDLGFGISATSGAPVSNRTGRGRTDWARGGRIRSYFDGGLVSLRRR